MALAKVTIEALTQMSTVLRQSADEILSSKSEMDGQLYSIPWDDPIGQAFSVRYEEDFKPLKEKLIPNIEQYLEYIRSLTVNLDAYSSDNGSVSSGIGAATATVAAGAGLAGISSSKAKSGGFKATSSKGMQPKQKEVIPIEEMDIDAVREELNPKQKAYYDEQKKMFEKRIEDAEFRVKIASFNASIDRSVERNTAATYSESLKADHFREEIAKNKKELERLDKWAREAVRINRNK